MKTYILVRDGDGEDTTAECRCVISEDGKPPRILSLDRSLRVVQHSPAGFNFGYGGSGPSQLAFAILQDYLDRDDIPANIYQAFKADFIEGAKDGERIPGGHIEFWLSKANK